MSDSNAASSAQTLLDALLELRRLGSAGVFSDSGRFRAFMLDLRPGLKKEVRVLSALIDAGYLQRLQNAAESEREIVSAQIRLWLDEELMLSADKAQYFSEVLLAFYNGESLVSAVVLSAQPGSGSAHTGQSQLSPQNSKPPVSSGCTADECFAKGARLYAKGQYREAADWYRKAAEHGDADAQYMLGNMYRDGVGVESDWDLAVDWYCLAAAQGHAEAKQALTLHSAPKSVPMPGAKPVPQSSPKPSAPQYAPKQSTPSLRDVYANKRVGERFEFGRYPQGKNGEVMPITWRVLRRDSDSLLVIAEKGLDCEPYHGTLTDINWADCSLRRWLNSEFYDKAFNEQERGLILLSTIQNNAGPATNDRVFLLNVDEANSLFADDADRMAVPTEFVIKNNVYTSKKYKVGNVGCYWWWLRSRGGLDIYAADINSGGSVDGNGNRVNYDDLAVRPAFNIALASRNSAPSNPTVPPTPSVPSRPSAPPNPAALSLRDIYANKRVGECFEFGRYPQGKRGGVRPIAWRVLLRDSDSLLVIAEKGLDCKKYHDEYTDITWADCTLRRWLNGEFYNKAFNEAERSLVLSGIISNNAGLSTNDRVFLLSEDEAESLFANADDRQAVPTEFAIKNNAYVSNSRKIGNVGCCWWWLRSRGSRDSHAALVRAGGVVGVVGFNVDFGDGAVRPAFRIAL